MAAKTKSKIDLSILEKLILLAKKHKLAELEVESGGEKFSIKTALGAKFSNLTNIEQSGLTESISGATSGTVAVNTKSSLAGQKPGIAVSESNHFKSSTPVASAENSKHIKVLSPFVGTFYRAPSPEAEPYVSVGKSIKKGEVLCIIEAMKLMNEIESEFSGKIVSILAENGQPIEYGEPLFLIDPAS